MNVENASEFQCSRDDCTFPAGGSCARAAEFADPPVECPHLVALGAPGPHIAEHSHVGAAAAPWSGNELVPEDLARELAGARPHVIAVLGERDCGKTTFLTALFLQIARGQRSFPYRFASSFTLRRLHALALEASHWDGKPGSRIVPRTPRASVARFLHFGLRPASERDDRVIDVLFSDIDGEAVRDHATYVSDDTRRVLGFLPRADVVLILVDAARLLSGDGEVYARTNVDIMLRVLADVATVPHKALFALVLTKYDRVFDRFKMPEPKQRTDHAAWGAIGHSMRGLCAQMSRAKQAGHRAEFFVSSAFPEAVTSESTSNVIEPVRAALEHSDKRRRLGLVPPAFVAGSPSFLAMGSERRGH